MTFNTTAPTGSLAGSGWEFQGRWGGFLGTPVSSNWFLAAKHVGGKEGDVFVLNGASYRTVRRVNHPTADLTLWRVDRSFPRHAALYTATDEPGKPVVVFGRSGLGGAEVQVPNASPSRLRGWGWGGPGAGTLRWGTNVVVGRLAFGGGDYLVSAFDRSGGLHEATLATGDSSGGVFIKDGTTWKLAGINYAVEADFAMTQGGAAFRAAVFDKGGLFAGATAGRRFLIPDGARDLPSIWLATRVSSFAGWIRATTAAGS